MKSFLILGLSLLTPALALPATTRSADCCAPPFKIAISTPSLPMFAPIYLATNGSTTTKKSIAALCYIGPSTELFCGDYTVPISAPLGAQSSLFSSVRESEQAPHVGMGGEMVSTGFSIDKDTLHVLWNNRKFSDGVRYVYKMDGSQSVWAVFANMTTMDSVGAELLAIFN